MDSGQWTVGSPYMATATTVTMYRDPTESINHAVELLQSGEIVALPTETVYGLAGDALNPTAIAKIFAAKNRPQDNPLIVHVSGMDMVRGLGLQVPEIAERLAERFWAGPLTMVLKKVADIIPGEISCGLDSVAVRMPDNQIMLSVIERLEKPLAAPSANLSGSPSPTIAAHVFADLGGRIPLIIDGGSCQIGIESTVVMFDGDKIKILRPGAVTPEMLSEFGEVIVDDGIGDNKSGEAGTRAQVLCPGTRHKHYSPKAEVIAVAASGKDFLAYVNKNLSEKSMAILNPDTRSLYRKLREFDKQKADKIYIRLPEQTGVGLALYNRIIRAANFNIVRIDKP